MEILLGFLAIALGVAALILLLSLISAHRQIAQLHESETALRGALRESQELVTVLESQKNEVLASLNASYQTSQAQKAQIHQLLQKYSGVIDVENELARIRGVIRSELGKLEETKQSHKSSMRSEQQKLDDLKQSFRRVWSEVERKTKELEAVEESLDLTDVGLYRPHYDFNDSTKYKLALDNHFEKQKEFLKIEGATFSAKTWSVGGSEVEGKRLTKDISKLALRAFNAECEAAIGNVSWSNFDAMKRRIERAFDAINKLVGRFHLSLTTTYLNLWLEELILTHEYKEQKEKEREEQRRINEQIREEERAQRELERAEREAEEDEVRIEKALESERRKLEASHTEDAERFRDKIAVLEAQLAEAHAKKERALSLAQQTRSGYVYIISNIGSFGVGVFKIGMTRRADPMDRVRELGDASVPFLFDVHGMIYTSDAPTLESSLHNRFEDRRVNLVNNRKEFFHVSIEEIVDACKELGVAVELTLLAEAKEFRQTLAQRPKSIRNATEEEQLSRAIIGDTEKAIRSENPNAPN